MPPFPRPECQRSSNWETVADGTLEEIAALVGDLMAVVGEVGTPPVGCIIWVQYPDAKYQTTDFSEFNEVASDLSREDAYLFCVIQAPAPRDDEQSPPVELSVSLSLRDHIDGPVMYLDVSGRTRTVVEGVNVRAKELVDAVVADAAERVRAAEEAAKEAQEKRKQLDANRKRQLQKLAEGAPPARVSRSRLRRLLDIPYAVQIIGGTIAGILVVVVAALLL